MCNLPKLVALLLLVAVSPALAQSGPLIFFVRHAEKAIDKTGDKDPDLSPAGQERAQELAHFFRDAEIKTIFVTEFKRTQETAAPLAKQLGITPEIVPMRDVDGLIKRLRDLPPTNALVIGHGDTIPRILSGFGITQPINIPEQDYDDVFMLDRGPVPHLVRFHQSK